MQQPASEAGWWSIPGQGVSTSTYLGKTAEATWVRCLGCIPSASMRAASLSHLKNRKHKHSKNYY